MKEEKEKYKTNCKLADKVWAKKDKLKNMTIKELTTICKLLKKKDDGPMPKKKIELIAKYNEWKHRPPPTFDTSDDDVVPIEVVESDFNSDESKIEIIAEQV